MDIKEKYKNARAFVVLLAALITWLLSLKYRRTLLDALILELIVIVIFFIVSSIAIKLIDRIRNMEVRTTTEIEDNIEQESNEDSEDNEASGE